MKQIKRAALVGLLVLVWGNVQADTYYLSGNQGSPLHWHTLTSWTNAVGVNPSAILAADDYDMQGLVLRTPATADPIFTGKSLISSAMGGAMLFKHSGTAILTNFSDSGTSMVFISGNVATQGLGLVNCNLSGWTRVSASAGRGIDLQVNGLSGIGDVRMGDGTSDLGYYGLTITGASGFAGKILSVFGTTDWKNNADLSSATYEIVTAGYEHVILNSDIIVKALIIGGQTYDPGVYSFAELNVAYDSSFVDGGTGSITVLKETYHLTAVMGKNKSWNNFVFWTNSLGVSPVSIDAGDEYFSDGFTVRSPSGGGSFAADLVMNSVLAFVSPDIFSIQKLTATGGAEIFGFSGTVTVHVVEFDAQAFFRTYSDAGKGLDFKVGTLSGGGAWTDTKKTSHLGYRGISITNGLAYTGEIQVVWGTTDFNNDVDIRNGSLSISTAGGGKVILDQDITVGSLVIGKQTYEDGTYSFAELNAAYDAKFVDGGTGSICVGEPAESYSSWMDDFPTLSGEDIEKLADPDSDGMNNLIEYALGGIPTNSDAVAISPEFNMISADGTNWLYYTYRRRLDAGDRGLEYAVLAGESLLGTGLTDATEEAGSVAIDGNFEMVSNRVDRVQSQTFMKLEVTSPE